jgi:hypothetical protein
MACEAVSLEHLRSHVELPEHETEHCPVQATWHVDPPEHDTLPLAPTVAVHVEPLVQSTLHDWSQLPVHEV